MLVEPNIYLYTNLLIFDRTYTSILLVCVCVCVCVLLLFVFLLFVFVFYYYKYERFNILLYIINILISYYFSFLKSKYYKSKFQYKFRFFCEPTLEQDSHLRVLTKIFDQRAV